MKRNISQAFIDDSDDSSDGKGSGSGGSADLEKEMLSLSKKNKNKVAPVLKKAKEVTYSQSDSSDSDSDWGSKSKGKKLKKKKKPAGRKSIRRSISAPSSEDDDDDQSVDTSRKAGSAEESTANQSSVKKDEDLEEGEVDDDSEESDGDSSEFNDGYDDNLMGDEEDKRRLNLMTEKEREQEIFKRIEQREVMKTRFDIEKKLRQAKKKETKRQKKSDSASLSSKFKVDAKERSKERKKTVEAKVDKKTQAMDQLKAKREAKKEREEEKEKLRIERELKNDGDDFEIGGGRDSKEDIDTKSTVTERSAVRKKLKASDIYSDDSASDFDNSSTINAKKESSSSESDSDDERSTGRPVDYVETVQDLNRIRLTRSKIEKWVHCPFFGEVAKGCFVRIGIGFYKDKAVYQVAEVLEVVETPRVYTLGNTRTNKGFKLRHGNNEKTFRLEYVSQHDFEDNEFKRWKEVCHERSILRPTLDDVENKVYQLTQAANYEFKEEDVEHIISEKLKFKQSPVNFAVRKTQLMKEKETAIQKGDEKRAEELSREIADLDDRAKELDKERSKSISSIGYINQRNRKKNVEQAEKAIMEEVRANKGKKVEDPFTRRNTKPMMASFKVKLPVGQHDAVDGMNNGILMEQVKLEITSPVESIEEEVTSANETSDETKRILDDLNLDDDEIGLTSDLIKSEISNNANKTLTIGDLFNAHDFDIKLELDEKVVLPNLPIVARTVIPPQVREVAPRRSLNLEDYKRKRGLI